MSFAVRGSVKSSLFKAVARSSTTSVHRSFSTTLRTRRPDIVQDLYLKELRAYKPPPVKPSDADAHVQKFNPPKLPKSPEESGLSSQMQEYESAAVEIEGQAPEGETKESEDDYFEDLKHLDEEPKASH